MLRKMLIRKDARWSNPAVILTSIIFFYVFFSLFNWAPLEEDSYIYFRFAENIASGCGYVFNPGGEKIEGCSSITWLFLLVLFELAGINILLAVKFTGIAFGCLSLFVIYKIALHVIPSPRLATLPSLLTAISVPFLLRNQMGLEEPLYTFIFLALILICLQAQHFKYWPFVFFLLIISRPEGIFIALALAPVFYHYRDRRKEIIEGVVVVAILTGVLFSLRLYYFHDFLPSPFYHKVFPGKYFFGLLYAHGFFKDYYMYLLLCPLICCLVFKRQILDKQKTVLLSFACVHCLWIVLAGACFFPFYRHFVTVIPLFYILAVAIPIELFPRMPALRNSILLVCLGIYGFAALVLPQANWNFLEREPNFIADNVKACLSKLGQYGQSLAKKIKDPRNEYNNALDTQTFAGLFIRNNYLPGTTFIYDQMGRLPYNAGTEYIFRDSNGLIDKKIGRAIFSIKSSSSWALKAYDAISRYIIKFFSPEVEFLFSAEDVIDAIFEQNPDVIMCCTLMRTIIINKLGNDPRLRTEYVPAYYMPGILFLERINLKKKEFNNINNLPMIFADEIRAQLPDHPWIAAPVHAR